MSGLAYPEENVKSAVVYILAQLSMKTPQNSLPTSLVQTVCRFISSNLASAKSHDLTLNLLGIIHNIYMRNLTEFLIRSFLWTSTAKNVTLVWSSQLHLFSGMFISIACMISLNTLDTEVECVGPPQV